MYDVEGEIAASESRAPSEEELIDGGGRSRRLAPVDAARRPDQEEEEEEEEDDFFDEKRLYEELDQALEAPVEERGGGARGAGERR